MKAIWKFPLSQSMEVTTVKMPKGAVILSAQLQQSTNTPTVWVLVDPEDEAEERQFVVVVTGDAPPPGATYLGTFQADGGFFVGHIYELT